MAAGPYLSVRYRSPENPLRYAFLAAFLFEAVVLTLVAWDQHWLAHPQRPTLNDDQFIEAQIYQMPPEAHLTAPEIAKPAPQPKEAAISKEVGKGRKAKPNESALPESNQTQSSSGPVGATHGPVPIYNPTPILPAYLQNQDINTAVVIEFLITSAGGVTPRLLRSSGNDELDAIAIGTVKKWQFRPAEQDHKAIDSKIRLKIVFEVH
jgi:TonB family protein